MTRSALIPVMEVFGPTIQGEGMVIGQKTVFVRTGGCDYSCAWCDSAFTWNGTEKAEMITAEALMARVLDIVIGKGSFYKAKHVTISGGNPALIGEGMAQFIALCQSYDLKVGLETQGSKWQEWFYDIDDLTISPKPPSSGMNVNEVTLDLIIDRLITRGTNFSLKVVVFDDQDYAFAQKIHVRYPHVPFYLSVGNTDSNEAGDISKRLLEKLGWLWDKVLNDPLMNNARPLPQLHTLVWHNLRAK